MRHSLRVSSIILSWPRCCACCGEAPEIHLRASASKTPSKSVVRPTTTWWEVPYCLRCSRHVSRYQLGKKAARVGVWGISGMTSLMLIMSKDFTAVAFLLGTAVAVWLLAFVASWKLKNRARKMMVPTCAAPDLAVEYGGWYGTSHELVFTSKSYREAFMAANQPKRISSVRSVERFQEAGG